MHSSFKSNRTRPSKWSPLGVIASAALLVLTVDPRAASASFQRRLARAAGEPDFAVLEAALAETEAEVVAASSALIGRLDPA